MYKIIGTLGALMFLVSCGNVSAPQPVVTDSSSGSVMNMMSLKKEQTTDVKLLLEQKSSYIISLLQKNDFSALASQVHPEKGLLLSADMFFDDQTNPRQILQRKELAGFLTNTTPRVWGSKGQLTSPLFMTGKDFWSTRLYTKIITQDAPRAYDDVLVTEMNTQAVLEAIQKKFPGSHFVEYKVVSSQGVMQEKDWSLRLIFSEYKEQWYLVGIVRD